MPPFTPDQFFGVFADYNAAVWPASLIAYGLAFLAIGSMLLGWKFSPRIVSGVLAAMWLWTGLAYHYGFFFRISAAAPFFAALFVLGAVIIAWQGIWREHIAPIAWLGWRSGMGWTLIAYASIGYPLIGLASGHDYAGLPQFGIAPCPVTLFTFGIFLLTPKLQWSVLVAPVIWSLIGGSAAFLLRVPQDWPLLFSGVLTLLIFVLTREAGGGPARER